MLRPRLFLFLALSCLAAFGIGSSHAPADENAISKPAVPDFKPEQIEFFEKQVKPVLENRCFNCHGNKEKIEGDLFLKSRSGVVTGGESGDVVTLNDPDGSPLLQAINYKETKMPPKGKLPAEEIAILTRWVKEGLPWTPGSEAQRPAKKIVKKGITDEDRSYWAYQPVKPVAVPPVKNAAWVKNPIDAFLLAKLEEKGLSPAPPADRVALVRRVYYDLTGLPPTPEEIDAFVNDKAADAYEKLIDRLLDSPRYGEKWGRHWLDIVRYAETHGYERDSAKPFAWRYRDYVINAFNQDKPYDTFIREQIAGDELEHVTADSLTATGYYRLGVWDDEPADRDQLKYDVFDGIVSTTGQAVLGTSIGCARCHDHKKDPIPTRDYYRLLAFFRDITDMQVSNLKKFAPEKPSNVAAMKEASEQKANEAASAEMRQLENKLLAALIEQKKIANDGTSSPTAGSAAAIEGERALLPDARVRGRKWQYTLEKPSGDWMQPDYGATEWKSGVAGFGTNGTPGAFVRTEWNTADIWLRKTFKLDKLPDSLALIVHHDEDVEIYINGTKAYEATGFLVDYERLALDAKVLKLLKTGENLIAVHCHQTVGGQYIDVGLTDRSPKLDVVKLMKQYGPEVLGKGAAERYFALLQQRNDAHDPDAPAEGIDIMCVDEKGHEPTFIMMRGNPHSPGEKVEPGVPEVLSAEPLQLPTLDAKAPHGGNRLALANWLTDAKNPLTARVMANRIWQFHFGRGIVPTPNDFGKLGEPPTHPELLDWLAGEFVRNGWRLKPLHKLIMLSNAYQMSSRGNEKALAIDGGNQWYWRFNMRRLEAEEARDSILAVSGKLNLKSGGPSVFPPIPKAVLAGQSVPGAGWSTSPPDEANRRSVYVHVKRSLIVPILAQLDSADTDSSCPVRYTSTVATQALNLLNSEFSQEQAAALATRLQRELPNDLSAQVSRAIRLTCGREPMEKEVARDVKFIADIQAKEKSNAATALKQYCLLILNANEFFYLD